MLNFRVHNFGNLILFKKYSSLIIHELHLSGLVAFFVVEVSIHLESGHHQSLLNTSPLFPKRKRGIVFAFPKWEPIPRLEKMVSIPDHNLKIILRGLENMIDVFLSWKCPSLAALLASLISIVAVWVQMLYFGTPWERSVEMGQGSFLSCCRYVVKVKTFKANATEGTKINDNVFNNVNNWL